MPIYEYRCENGHTFEVFQSMSDDPVKTCEECDAPVQRVLHPVAIHFKGSGFHNTDYKDAGKAPKPSKEGGESDSSDSGSGESKDSGKASESKSDSESPAKSTSD